MSNTLKSPPDPLREFREFRPSDTDVKRVITDAKNHSLGLDFLENGDLESVAVLFSTHVFTVQEARKKINKMNRKKAPVDS